MTNRNLVLVSGACLFKERGGVRRWFVVKTKDDKGWELPKVLVRKGESSVRAVLRMLGERGGMSTRVLEEAGRAGGTTTLNGKTLPQRFIYYLMILRASSEVIGFPEYAWFDYSKALRSLSSKREKGVLRAANKEFKRWKKRYQKKIS